MPMQTPTLGAAVCALGSLALIGASVVYTSYKAVSSVVQGCFSKLDVCKASDAKLLGDGIGTVGAVALPLSVMANLSSPTPSLVRTAGSLAFIGGSVMYTGYEATNSMMEKCFNIMNGATKTNNNSKIWGCRGIGAIGACIFPFSLIAVLVKTAPRPER